MSERRAAVIWQEADGWHYKMARNLNEALKLEDTLTPAQRFRAFSGEGSTEAALRYNFWQMAAADNQEIPPKETHGAEAKKQSLKQVMAAVRRRKPRALHVWTIKEIKAKRFRDWFYGLVRVNGKVYLAEIFPTEGAALLDWHGDDGMVLRKDPIGVLDDLPQNKTHRRAPPSLMKKTSPRRPMG